MRGYIFLAYLQIKSGFSDMVTIVQVVLFYRYN